MEKSAIDTKKTRLPRILIKIAIIILLGTVFLLYLIFFGISGSLFLILYVYPVIFMVAILLIAFAILQMTK